MCLKVYAWLVVPVQHTRMETTVVTVIPQWRCVGHASTILQTVPRVWEASFYKIHSLALVGPLVQGHTPYTTLSISSASAVVLIILFIMPEAVHLVPALLMVIVISVLMAHINI